MKKRVPWNKGKKGLINNGGFKKGHIVSPETREKIRIKAINPSEEVRLKMRLSHLGKKRGGNPENWKHKEETKEKIRQAKLGTKASIETRKKLSLSHQGEKGSGWKGGVTPIHEKIRKSLEYKLWREAVFDRDNYTCIWCGSGNKNGERTRLNADHIKPFSLFPELRFAIDNGRTLCVDCHKKTETYGLKIKK